MIVIRTDGNSNIGMGHIMRCLTIADEIIKLGKEVVILTAGEESIPMIVKRGFAAYCIGQSYQNPEAELDNLTAFLTNNDVSCILLDSYFVTEDYMSALKRICKVAYVDDVLSFLYPANVLINYNVFAVKDEYIEMGFTQDTKLMLGCDYAPVREEFRSNSEEKDYVRDVFLSLGGSDMYDLTTKLIQMIRHQFPGLRIHAVCGPFNKYADTLYAMSSDDKNIVICRNSLSLSSEMRQCDVAISAGGTTMYELAAMKKPIITFSYVDNQKRIAEGFAQKKAALTAGHYSELDEDNFLLRVEKQLKIYCEDKLTREDYSKRAKLLVDGFGAVRIATELTAL